MEKTSKTKVINIWEWCKKTLETNSSIISPKKIYFDNSTDLIFHLPDYAHQMACIFVSNQKLKKWSWLFFWMICITRKVGNQLTLQGSVTIYGSLLYYSWCSPIHKINPYYPEQTHRVPNASSFSRDSQGFRGMTTLYVSNTCEKAFWKCFTEGLLRSGPQGP